MLVKSCVIAPRERLVLGNVGFVARGAARPPFAPHRAQPIPEARQPLRRLERRFGFGREVLEELVHVRHVPGAVDPHRVVLVLHLPDVARRAVQPDHLRATQLRRVPSDTPTGRPYGLPRALGIGQQPEALDVVEEPPDLNAAIARRHFDVEGEQPVEGKELAALRQVIEAALGRVSDRPFWPPGSGGAGSGAASRTSCGPEPAAI